MTLSFPVRPGELDAEWLSEALDRRIDGFQLRPIGAGRGNLGELVVVEFEDGLPVVAKFAADRAETLASALRSGLFEREIRFYRELAPQLGLRLPRLYAAEYDPVSARFVMILDYIAPSEDTDTVRSIGVERTREVLDVLAHLHEDGRRLADTPWLQSMTFQGRIDNLALLIGQGWPRLIEICGDLVPSSLGDGLTERFVDAMHQLAALDQTLVHGDVKPDNLIIDNQGVVLIDWQAVGCGPPAWDVASCMYQCLSTEDRRRYGDLLLAAYPHDLSGYEQSLVFGLVVACALTQLGDPDEPRMVELVATMTERTVSAMADAGVL